MCLASCGVVTAVASNDIKMDEPEDRLLQLQHAAWTQQGLGEVLVSE